MKVSYKILLWTIIIMAAAFGTSGYLFVNYVFKTSMEREIGQAMDESSILQFAFETAALNIPSKYDVLHDNTIEEIGSNLERGGQGMRLLRLSDEERLTLYASEGFTEDTVFLGQIQEQSRIYQVIQMGDSYYVQTGTAITTLDRILYLETMRNVTGVFDERTRGFGVYRNVSLVMLGISAVVMFFISRMLTRPIRQLTRATRRMAAGDYAYRVRQISNDEMGQLTGDFNLMAKALEENIGKLEEEIRAKEDFIAAFSHELKTPLTAIIGYADLLRSRKLDEETYFLSANYIYTEGKRLEAMSFRLLEIIVARNVSMELAVIDTRVLEQYLTELYGRNQEYPVSITMENSSINVELDLLKSVLLNLVDNAIKASEPGSPVEIIGRKQENGYRIAVKDYGVGIPAEECRKITEAFYMVDKSRARSKNGAGLGLALCVAVLELHHSSLHIESVPGKGSTFSFIIPGEEKSTYVEKKN
ncbi:MAG: HAMP domain-containing histidine kinase [Lachnospiraceae bacterium]|nr:HAMP domain-containing histidine kinase [Lachnospiraceae bacterium]